MTASLPASRTALLRLVRGHFGMGSVGASSADGLDTAGAGALANECRVGPLVHTLSESEAFPAALRETMQTALADRLPAFRAQSMKAFAISERRYRMGRDLCLQLEDAGIPCIGYRGPFAGQRLYEDAALRPFGDVDLLVPVSRIQDVWTVAHSLGYRSGTKGASRGFLLRHHLHWLMFNGHPGSACDLHWAVEHPYRMFRIDYEGPQGLFARSRRLAKADGGWRELHPEDLCLLMALQFSKADSEQVSLLASDHPEQAFFRGKLFFKWLDLALCVHRHADEIDFEAIEARAADWRCSAEWALALHGLRHWLPAISAVPSIALSDMPFGKSIQLPGWLNRIALSKAGFRAEKFADALDYMRPPAGRFNSRLARLAHQLKAPFVLGLGACDAFAANLAARFAPTPTNDIFPKRNP